MALGAQRKTVIGLVLKQGMQLALIGILGGVAASVILTRALSSLLFGITPTDPVTWIGVSVVLPLVCGVACYLPARRAARVDPIAVLKQG
jgi:putative ABC transport system permease protein